MSRIFQSLSALISPSEVISCSTHTAHGKSLNGDELFGITVPGSLQSRNEELRLHGLARRCMHDLCWFSPARAYILGVYVDSSVSNRMQVAPTNDAHSSQVPKTFVLFFASYKDSKHIKKGFERSYSRFIGPNVSSDSQQPIHALLKTLQDMKQVNRDDSIRITCVPAKNTVYLSINNGSEIEIADAQTLIEWLHWLYLGTESQAQAQYPSMQNALFADFANSQRYRQIVE